MSDTIDYHTITNYQRALGLEAPASVLWKMLAGILPPAEFQAVRQAHHKATQRYHRAARLNQMARWLRQVEARSIPASSAKIAKWRAILSDPAAYIERGE